MHAPPRPRAIAAVLALLAPLLAAVPAPAQGVTVTGRVTDGATGQGVAGATVRAAPGRHTAATGPDGGFTLRLPAGDYVLQLSAPGYLPANRFASALADAAVGEVALAPDPVRLRAVEARASRDGRVRIQGVVVDARTRLPLPAATAGITRLERLAAADGAGSFALERVPAGTHLVTFRALGYQPVIHAVEAGADVRLDTVALQPDPILLQGIKATVDRLERRLRAYPRATRLLKREQIVATAATNALDLVQTRTGLYAVPCSLFSGAGRSSSGRQCYRVRGTPTLPSVYIDERPAFGGMDELAFYDPRDIERIEVYGGGVHIRVYTTWFMESMAKRRFLPQPIIF